MTRRGWTVALVAVLGLSLVDSGAFSGGVLNAGGLPVAGRFLAAAAAPDLTGGYLAEVAHATAVTLAYAVLGTVLSVLAGLLGAHVATRRAGGGRAGWLGVRIGLAVPRGLHEALWGLLFVTLLGPDPLAAVLAIAVPYGAITAKVYADLLDDAPREPYELLRAAGAGRVAAVWYALLPYTAADMLSYALYRLDCAIRSAVILGIIGAGGVGLLLDNAFQDLSYPRMWTALYALLALCAAGDLLSRWLRRRLTGGGRPSPARGLLATVLVAAAAAAAAWGCLGVDVGTVLGPQSRAEAGYLAAAAWPPVLPDGGLPVLLDAVRETVQMSVLALAVAVAGAVVLAPSAARRRVPGRGSAAGAAVRVVVRAGLLCVRVVPAPVWALLLLFVVHPGPLPGALALAAYNLGVLGRLTAEVVEDLDPAPERALRAIGAGPAAAYAYAVLPRATPRYLAYGVYRWEVAVRETVVVGLVGAGGLGYLLAGQLAAFDWPAVAATLLTLIALTCIVDLVGAAARRAWR